MFAELEQRETQICLLDLALVSFTQTFILLLALNFQWSTTTVTARALADGLETKQNGLIRARNSIALHNLRLSGRDMAELELEKKHPTVKNSASLQQLFEAEKKIAAKKKHRTQDLTPEIDLSPQLGPPEKLQERVEFDLSIFRKVQRSILMKLSRNNQSPGYTPNPKQTRKLDVARLNEDKRRSLDILSPAHLASYHNRIDQTFN